MPRVALIGWPLQRRHSQVMHDAAFERYGIDAHYELIELEPSELDSFFAEARDAAWLGFQVNHSSEPGLRMVGSSRSRLRWERTAVAGPRPAPRQSFSFLNGGVQ